MAWQETAGPFLYTLGRKGSFLFVFNSVQYVQHSWEAWGMNTKAKKVGIVFSIALVAACAPVPKPVPPPVVRPVIYIPPPPPPPPVMPLPPSGAAATMKIPPLGLDGIRATPNRGLSVDETIWNLRSAINVSALNCRGPIWDEITANYNKLLAVHKVRLTSATKAVDREYIARYPGQNGLRVRDTKSTDLYNYFALPPIKQEYCDTSLAKTRELLVLPPASLQEYSVGALAEIDGIYIRFFNAYAQYERDLADWNQRFPPVLAPIKAPVAASVPPPAPVASGPKKPG
jgi:hypothetical protein